MKINGFFYNAAYALVMGGMLVAAMGCPGSKEATEVTSCSELSDETACNLAKQKDGKKCIHDGSKCAVFVPGGGGQILTGNCEDYGTDAAKCGMRNDCAINATSTKCEAVASDCVNVKDETACKTTYGKDSNATCEWAAGACKKAVAPTTANYSIYEFASVPVNAIRPRPWSTWKVVSSKAHVVYVIGQSDGGKDDGEVAVIDRTTDGVNWEEMDLTTGDTPAAGGAVAFNTDHADAKIVLAAPLHDGIVVYEPGAGVIGILEDGSTDAQVAWTLADANLRGAGAVPTAFFEVANGVDHFIYASSAGGPANALNFFKRGHNVNNWIGGYSKDGAGAPLTESYLAFGLGTDGNLLLGADNGSIYEIESANFGVDVAGNKKLKGNAATASVAADAELRHTAGIANGAINKIVLVDNRYLLVGFGNKAVDRGGLFFADISAGLPLAPAPGAKWQTTGDNNHDVKDILVDHTKPSRAVIATDVGLMIFDGGIIVQIVAGQNLINGALVADPANKGNITDRASAKTGFAGGLFYDNPNSLAQDQDGKFYIGSWLGVLTLQITSKDL